MDRADGLALLSQLQARGYRFTTVSPATHAKVVARPQVGKATLRDIFGWSKPFREEDLEPDLLQVMRHAGALLRDADGHRSAVRISSLGDNLFIHSAFPTESPNSVFFGPDTYRFARFIRESLPRLSARYRIIDMGCGSGAGGVVAAQLCKGIELTFADLNPAALHFANINAAFAGLNPRLLETDRVPGGGDLVLANPPYMIDKAGRTYRDGGNLFGGEVALTWVEQALNSMQAGGVMLLYTGAAVVNGRMPLLDGVNEMCFRAGASVTADEIDPDVFGEDLDQSGYECVERIAAVGMTIRLPGETR